MKKNRRNTVVLAGSILVITLALAFLLGTNQPTGRLPTEPTEAATAPPEATPSPTSPTRPPRPSPALPPMVKVDIPQAEAMMGFKIPIPEWLPSPTWRLQHILVEPLGPWVLILFSDEPISVSNLDTRPEIDMDKARLYFEILPFEGGGKVSSAFLARIDADDPREFKIINVRGYEGYVAASVKDSSGRDVSGVLRIYTQDREIAMYGYLTEAQLLEIAESLTNI